MLGQKVKLIISEEKSRKRAGFMLVADLPRGKLECIGLSSMRHAVPRDGI